MIGLLIQLIAQLKANMGAGHFKSIAFTACRYPNFRKNLIFVEAICDVLHPKEIQATGGLPSWFNCLIILKAG